MPPHQKKTTEAEIRWRARRAPTAPDKTPPPPATPPPPRRRQRQPAPPTEPAPASAEGPPVELDPIGADDALLVLATSSTTTPMLALQVHRLVPVVPGTITFIFSLSEPLAHPSACFAPPPTAKSPRRAACIAVTCPAQKTYRQIWGGQRRLDFFSIQRKYRTDRSGSAYFAGSNMQQRLTSGRQVRQANQHRCPVQAPYEHHIDAWVEGCDQLKIPIKAKEAARFVDAYRMRKHQKTGNTSNSEPGKKRRPFSQEAFVDAIVEFIVGDDQSINVVENEQLRASSS
ncbi:hypothetical protein B0H14DRAFT_2601098 [Mycena olivaceomarginata]|nr:hypothetical protein B0H14DRAFT_2601098 [Mycena olivaceomarginata]